MLEALSNLVFMGATTVGVVLILVGLVVFQIAKKNPGQAMGWASHIVNRFFRK